MADAGEQIEFVNSGNVSLVNATDSATFKQLYNLRVSITQNVVTKQTISNLLDKHFDLRDFVVEGDIMITEPEIATWIGYTVQTNNLPPAKSFQIIFTADNGNTSTVSGTFRIKDLFYEIPEEGDANYHVRLESVDGAVVES